MSKRQRHGLQLYNEGHVTLEYWDDELILIRVKSSENPHQHHLVSCNGDSWRCSCSDYHHRWQNEYGSFNCKHIVAALFLFIGKQIKKRK